MRQDPQRYEMLDYGEFGHAVEMWAMEKTARDIARELKLASRSVVLGIIRRAREAGDPRAEIRKERPYHRPQGEKS